MPEGGSEIPLRILYLGESSATSMDAECQTKQRSRHPREGRTVLVVEIEKVGRESLVGILSFIFFYPRKTLYMVLRYTGTIP